MTPFNQPYFDYDKQVWIQDGVYLRCGHPETMQCACYGRQHAGKPATTPAAPKIDGGVYLCYQSASQLDAARPIGETAAREPQKEPGRVAREQIKAAVDVVTAVAEAIRQAGSIPSGHIYALLMDRGITIQDYDAILALLTRAGLIRQDRTFRLHWVSRKS